MARLHRSDTYRGLIKWSSVAGICLFLLGEITGDLVRYTNVSIPAWERTLLVDATVLGVALAIVLPITFYALSVSWGR